MVVAVAAIQRGNVLSVKHTVVIRVILEGIGAGEIFLQVGEVVAIEIPLCIPRIEVIETVARLEAQRHAVAVIINGAGRIEGPEVMCIWHLVAVTVGVTRVGPELVLLKIGELISILIAIGISGVVVAETILFLVPVRHAIAIGIGIGIGGGAVGWTSGEWVFSIRQGITIGIEHVWPGAGSELLPVGEAILV
ncbi:hypothetical protein Maes01_00814 [Microbulbifer aestuariivivens]|uniref:Uncharacterized protein n=1 Tax=Microbulbifer aestuariivivens TaxID=1908308 RepID=A0ABP9WPX4_9GAMM